MSEEMKTIATALGDLVLPRFCVACGDRLHLDERHLCLECLADLSLTHFWQYGYNAMADRFNARLRSVIPDGVRVEYASAAALFFYNSESPYRRIPQALKYRGNVRAGRYFAAMLGRHLAASADFRGIEAVIPVPLHWTRRLTRGYNQSEVIARELARALGAELVTGKLWRNRRTRTQTRMGMTEKAGNVSGAFSVHGSLPYRHVLLVDDTFTTGATLVACSAAVLPALRPGARISVATLAFVSS